MVHRQSLFTRARSSAGNLFRRAFNARALAVFLLWTVAVVQPLLEVLAGGPTFFVVRGFTPVRVAAFSVLFGLLAPILLILAIELVGSLHRHIRKALYGATIAGLLTLLLMLLAKGLATLPAWVVLLGALALALVLTREVMALGAGKRLLQGLAVLCLSALALQVWFLGFSPVAKLVGQGEAAVSAPEVNSRTPIVMIVFDEFPIATLLDRSGQQVDAEVFPNFARVSREFNWYRNTYTVSDSTIQALPAILTGSFPDPDKPPLASQYPRSLFTLLEKGDQIRSVGARTGICSPLVCGKEKKYKYVLKDLEYFAADLRLVYLHRVLPARLAEKLPSVTQDWVFARKHDKVSADSPLVVESFLTGLQPYNGEGKPPLHFMHVILPHVPYVFLPDGQRYTRKEFGRTGLDESKRNGDVRGTLQMYQRHMMQTAYVDKLMGLVVDRLKQQGLYDQSLVIITADHGVSFWPGTFPRVTEEKSLYDVGLVPLFVKPPKLKAPQVVERNVQNIDILPTIADVVGVAMPWKVDGQSLLATERPPLKVHTIMRASVPTKKFELDDSKKVEAHKGKWNVFGDGRAGFYQVGPFRALVGKPLSALPLGPQAEGLTFNLLDPEAYTGIDPEMFLKTAHAEESFAYRPAVVSGLIQHNGQAAPKEIGISVNGVMAGVYPIFTPQKDGLLFSAIVNHELFQRPGFNEIRVFALEGTPAAPVVREIRRKKAHPAS